MHLKTLVSITLLSTILQLTTQSPINTHNHPQKHNTTLQKQISTTLKFFDYPRCTTSNLTTQLECSYLSTLPKQNITVYYATSSPQPSISSSRPPTPLPHGDVKIPRTKVTAIFLEHSGNPPPTNPSSSPHDAIIVLDPYPNKSFGHLLAVFYIDYNVPDFHDCKEPYQIYTIDKTCVTLATKPKCPNKLDKYYYGGSIEKRCQIDFLPTVFSTLEFNYLKDDGYYGDDGSMMMPRANLLACVELKEFSSCPKLRGLDDTNRVVCDGAVGNSKRCDTSHTGVGTRCKLFQTCDRAILLSGGWNRLHSGYKYYDNIVKVQDTLSSLGFLRDNVKTFFGNGKVREVSNAQGDDAIHRYEASSFFSSAMKTGLRGHVRTVCENPYCSDTVFIYLNSHVLGGGSGGMVLWDFDYDGVINTELESYTVKEFVSDIRNCEANRVIVVADQAYSSSLVSAINGSVEHRNVVLVVPKVEEPMFGVVTDAFVEGVRGGGCFKRGDTQSEDAYVVVDNSGSGSSSSVSLTGAPCGLLFGGKDFVKKRYEGCQNVPISVWFSITSTTANDDDDDDDDDRDSGEEPGGGVRSQDSSSGDDKSPNWRRLLQ